MIQNNGKIVVQVDSFLEELIPVYLSNRKKDVLDILQALEQGDFETVRFLGHNMRGSGGGYGLIFFSDIGHCLEVAAQDKDTELIRKHLIEITNYLEKIDVIYV